jgi:hypothetical protein
VTSRTTGEIVAPRSKANDVYWQASWSLELGPALSLEQLERKLELVAEWQALDRVGDRRLASDDLLDVA